MRISKSLIILALSLSSVTVFAEDTAAAESAPLPANHAFQEFDNQFYIGFGTSYGNFNNAYGQNSNYGTTYVGLGVERLFDIGLWASIDATMMTGYSNFNSANANAGTGPLGQNPAVANLDAKVGYAFNPIKDKLQVTPYILVGRNTNLTSNSLNNNTSNSGGGTGNLSANVTQDYFLTGGIGGRIEYRIDKYLLLYFDQNALYNADMSSPNSNYNPASNYQLTSTLGLKYNAWDQLQLGLNSFYTYNQLSGAVSSQQQYQLYQQNQVGIMATVGMTY